MTAEAQTESTPLVRSSDGRFVFRLPPDDGLEQDQEWISFKNGGDWTTLRLHDYEHIFRTPGLYEAIVYDVLGCQSPTQLVRLFHLVLQNWMQEPGELRVLDLGAGNGIVGERLRAIGTGQVVGVDILQEAARAADRDRPDVYDAYLVDDLTNAGAHTLGHLERRPPNTLITVAALGFGDIPPAAFRTAFNAVTTPGWLALTIKEDFLSANDDTGYAALLRRLLAADLIAEEARLRIRHRESVAGEPIFYMGIVARKLGDIPDALAGDVANSTDAREDTC